MMNTTSEESDIQFNLVFLDCSSKTIDRLINDPIVFNHLHHAARNPILRFQRSYQREESDRVTDIDEISSTITFTSSVLTKESRLIPIEIVRNDKEEVTTPMENPIVTPMEIKSQIPPAPPLPSSLDSLSKVPTTVVAHSPEQDSLWSNVSFHYIIESFDQ